MLEKTEGWAAGLRLFTVADKRSVSRLGEDVLTRGELFISHFLIDEVLTQQHASMRELLLLTSICDRFCGPLYEALADGAAPGDGEKLLGDAVRAELFLTSTDGAGKWFRYHPLFRKALLQRLRVIKGETGVEALHRRASEWLANHDMLTDALWHALAANEPTLAAELVESKAVELLNSERWVLLADCLQRLPEALIRQRAGLLIARAWVLQIGVAIAPLRAVLDRASVLLDDSVGSLDTVYFSELRVQRDALQVALLMFEGHIGEALRQAPLVLNRLPEHFRLARRNAYLVWAIASHCTGQGEEARAQLETLLTAAAPGAPTGDHAFVLAVLAFFQGDLTGADQLAQLSLANCADAAYPLSAVSMHYLLGQIHFLRGDAARARGEFDAAMAQCSHGNAVILRETLIGLALAHQALGDRGAARSTVDLAEELQSETVSFDPYGSIAAARTHLALLSDERPDVSHVSQTYFEPFLSLISFALECVSLTNARALSRSPDMTACARAGPLFDWLVEQVETFRDVPRLVEVLAARAEFQARHGARDTALGDLTRAVSLAKPGGITRPFLELDDAMTSVLQELVQNLPESEREFPAALLTQRRARHSFSAISQRKESRARLPARLTWREADVLALLATFQTNKEIGERLNISPATVKKHVASVCVKLGVLNRRQAGSQAQALLDSVDRGKSLEATS